MLQENQESLEDKLELLKRGVRGGGLHLSWQDPKMSRLETILARGDRRLAGVVWRAWQLGCRFDAWSEHFGYNKWLLAFSEAGLDPGFYAHRERSLKEIMPWGHIDTGVSTSFLWREYLRIKSGKVTPDCRLSPCSACGMYDHSPQCKEEYAPLLEKPKSSA